MYVLLFDTEYFLYRCTISSAGKDFRIPHTLTRKNIESLRTIFLKYELRRKKQGRQIDRSTCSQVRTMKVINMRHKNV